LEFWEDARIREEAAAYLQRSQEFSQRERKLHPVDVREFLNMKFRKEDWRRVRDPHRKEILLSYEVEDRMIKKMDIKRIATELGISETRVRRLINGERRYPRPVFYMSGEILWPKGSQKKPERRGSAPQ